LLIDHKQFCLSRLKKFLDDYQIIDKKGINEIEIDSLKGYELYAKNLDRENVIVLSGDLVSGRWWILYIYRHLS